MLEKINHKMSSHVMKVCWLGETQETFNKISVAVCLVSSF